MGRVETDDPHDQVKAYLASLGSIHEKLEALKLVYAAPPFITGIEALQESTARIGGAVMFWEPTG